MLPADLDTSALGLLPLVTLVAMAVAGWRRRGDGDTVLDGVMAGTLLWGAALVLLSEFLSLTGWLQRGPLILAWGTLLAAAAGVAIPAGPRDRPAPVRRPPVPILLALGIPVVLAVTLATALLAPPGTSDSMTYHLSRVEHWVANGSLAHYPTAIDRQLHSPPFAELVILHLRLLAGDDRFANLVQWFAFLGSALAAARITARFAPLAVNRPVDSGLAPVLAALFVVTAPMAILQASSTQNDLTVGCLLLILADRLLAWRDHPARAVPAALFGLALGLALLTKGTAYLIALPMVLAFAALALRHPPPGQGTLRGLAAGALAAGLTLALNAGHLLRNWSLFGNPLAAPPVGVEVPGLGSLASNALRNLASGIATPLRPVNDLITAAVAALHGLFGLDPSDPATTYPDTSFVLSTSVHHEDTASNPLHLLLLAAALVLVAGRRPLRTDRALGLHTAMLLGGTFLFLLMLRWQPWITRLQLPLLLLAAPVVAAALVSLPRRAAVAAGALLLVASTPWLLENRSRSLLGLGGRPAIWQGDAMEHMFVNRPALLAGYRAAAGWAAARGGTEVGFAGGVDSWEYPLWVLLRDAAGHPIRLRHVCLPDHMADARTRPPAWPADRAGAAPATLILVDRPAPSQLRCAGTTYERAATFDALTAYTRAD